MNANNFQKVARLEELPSGKTLCVEVQGREILLCRTPEGVYALDNLCTHAAARLCEGKLKGHRILCPLHGAAFDVRDGAALSRPASIPVSTYPVQVDGDSVSVLMDGGEDP